MQTLTYFLVFDASGKLPGGLMQYYEADLGNYDQCLEVETKIQQKNLIGKYCISMLEIDYATLIFTKNSIKHRSVSNQIYFTAITMSSCHLEF